MIPVRDPISFASGALLGAGLGLALGVQGLAPASPAGASMGHGWPAFARAVGPALEVLQELREALPDNPLFLALLRQELPVLASTYPADIISTEKGHE